MPLTSKIHDIFTGRRHIRVALMGRANSGKTVFLAAVHKNLTDNSGNFELNGLRVRHYKPEELDGPMLEGFPLFDSLATEQAFRDGHWPDQTTDPKMLALPLTLEWAEMKNGKNKTTKEDVLLEILDIPGERVADFPMMGRSYKDWCRWLEITWAGSAGKSHSYRNYLAAVGDIAPGADDASQKTARQAVFDAYRDFVADDYGNYATQITPSTILLDWTGAGQGGSFEKLGQAIDKYMHEGAASSREADARRESRPYMEAFRQALDDIPIGFRDETGRLREFVPLPQSAFARKSPWRPLVREFEKAYGHYVEKIIRPLERWLRNATILLYLVDVLSLLRAGPRAWHAERNYGQAAIRMLCPDRSGNFLQRAGRRLCEMLLKTRIHTVRVIATKADLVLEGDGDNLTSLAGKLLEDVLDSPEKQTLPCAAIRSTEEVTVKGDKRALRGRYRIQTCAAGQGNESPVQGEGGGDAGKGGNRHAASKTWIPSHVPKAPPAARQWEEASFNYPETASDFDPDQGAPPLHIGLNTIVTLMLKK